MKIVGYILGGIIVISLLGLMIIGALSPETSVYLGHEVPKSYVKEMKEYGFDVPKDYSLRFKLLDNAKKESFMDLIQI